MQYDSIIVGAGSMGMAAGYYLAKQGKNVLLIDAGDPPHAGGSHHGETRIIRHAYGEGENYVNMALRAQDLWEELQEETGQTIFHPTGVINVGKEEDDFIQNVIKSAEHYHLDVEKMTHAEINQRWPGFSIPADLIGCYERKSGVLMSEQIIQAYRDGALKYGAVLQVNEAVTNIVIEDDIVTIMTEKDNYQGASLILTPGAYAKKLLANIGIDVPLDTVRKTFSWFDAEEDVYAANHFPAFSFVLDQGTYYGFPSVEGAGIKIGRHDGGQKRAIDQPNAPFGTYSEDEQDVSVFANHYFSEAGKHRIGKVCTYTNTPDGDFIIDRHPDYQHVVFACGFSGHGYKFASVVGETLARFVAFQEPLVDISTFTYHRF
ncbi:N-methyl-L-tryptophan oxidase [Gracilibacillus sp. S3-1-1]|uniref:N-methyl-L-tryptophan oxidase n=1 Tax=Gracilibacillus pellucidus TaxID=3095368 RepID=A0ACC6M9T2_9BACI|nr:N-methyl-L-tryptophan oxidase [Gracilibacillus sp. S3-1-1]MDX8047699.1 N-methyl-L-tryptophan oxidase [Gracilibacillus sp. S3-1-1]